MVYKVRIFLGIILLVIISCKEEDKQSDPSFIALEHNSDWYKEAGLLIKKVHDKTWTIAFGFGDSDRCNGDFTKDHIEQLKEQLTNVFKLWLKPLYDIRDNPKNNLTINQPIVTDFSYEERAVNSTDDKKELAGNKDYAMGLVVRCEIGRSYAHSYQSSSTVVHMFMNPSKIRSNTITDLHRYRLTTLLHEVGHAMGLADTYTDKSPGTKSSRFSIASTGGDSRTVGRQPLSAMNLHYLVALNHLDEINITDDDRDGIEWLYRRYIKESVEANECPTDYQYEASTNGCTPKYLFIHTARQGNIDAINRLLKADSKIDINQQDSLGNTALHYAAAKGYRDLHGDKLYLYLQSICHPDEDSCSDPTIANNAGETAEQLFADNDDLDGFRQAIATTLANKNTLFASGLIKAALVQGHNSVVEYREIRDMVNTIDGKLNTMLNHASQKNWADVAKVLLSIDQIDINLGNDLEQTALHYSVTSNDASITNMLLSQSKIKTTTPDINGDTPLHRAAMWGRKENLQALLSRKEIKANINTTNDDNRTPFHLAAAWNWDSRVEAFNYLLEQPEITEVVVNGRDKDGYTPLHLAAKAGRSPKVVGVLLADKRVDQTLIDNEGRSALPLANQQKAKLEGEVAELEEKITDLASSTDAKDKNKHREYTGLVVEKNKKIERLKAIVRKLCQSSTFNDNLLCQL